MHHPFPIYGQIQKGEQIPKYIQNKHKPIDFRKEESTLSLWNKHEMALLDTTYTDIIASPSMLDLKIELASRMFKRCHFCEHHCGVDRRKTIGNCQSKESLIASEFLHFGEESLLVPSHTIFFSGCTLSCVFCQNYDISQHSTGLKYQSSEIADRINYRKKQGSINVNWVGGDPTPHLLLIFQSLQYTNTWLPQLWNSNMYCSEKTMQLLDGIIDVYLTDFKFGNNNCATRLCGGPNYVEIVKRNHLFADQQAEVLIRHLVLPEHVQCCTYPIIDFISNNLQNAWVNIMDQYRPMYQAEAYPELTRAVSKTEMESVRTYASEKGLHII